MLLVDAANVFHVPVKGHRLTPTDVWLLWRGDPNAPKLHPTTVRGVIEKLTKNALGFVSWWGLLGLHRVEPWATRWADRWSESLLPRDGTAEPLEFFLEALFSLALACDVAVQFGQVSGEERRRLALRLARGWEAGEFVPALRPYAVKVPGLSSNPPWLGRIDVVYEPRLPRVRRLAAPQAVPTHNREVRFVRHYRHRTLWDALWVTLGEVLVTAPDYLRHCKRETCGRLFYAKRKDQEYCSESCRKIAQQSRARARRQGDEDGEGESS